MDEVNVKKLREEGSVSLESVREFEKLKKSAEETPKNLFIGEIPKFEGVPPQARSNEFGETEVQDPDGEIVSIKDLNLVVAGSLADEVPPVRPELMRDFVEVVARAGTWNQRHLPIWQKIVLLWRVFLELFFNRAFIKEDDPYVMVVAQWYRKQQIPQSFKVRLSIFLRNLRDLFIHTPQAAALDTYGMPGFEMIRRVTSRS